MPIWTSGLPKVRSLPCRPLRWKGMPMARRIRSPHRMRRSSPASTRTALSRAASGTPCPRKPRRPLRKPWSMSTVTDPASVTGNDQAARCAVSGKRKRTPLAGEPGEERGVELTGLLHHDPVPGGEGDHAAAGPRGEALGPRARVEHERFALAVEVQHRAIGLEHLDAAEAARYAEPAHRIAVSHLRMD